MIDIKKGVEDLADTIERKRQEFNANREKNNIGTFVGLKRLLKKQAGRPDGTTDQKDAGQPSSETTREDPQ